MAGTYSGGVGQATPVLVYWPVFPDESWALLRLSAFTGGRNGPEISIGLMSRHRPVARLGDVDDKYNVSIMFLSGYSS